MRFVHTSDWHLGRSFYGFDLIEDQAHVLEQIVRITADARADAVVVAGDVYDRAVPPPDAVRLLDETLARIAIEARTRVVAIAGNHDAPERLGFASRLLAASGVHVVGRLTEGLAFIPFDDDDGPIDVVAVPYAEPAVVRSVLADPSLRDHDLAFGALAERARRAVRPGARAVLVAHVFASGGAASESERPLSVGGSGAVDPRAFEGFHYSALGHLHRPQSVGRKSVRYSGSPLKYSLSEVDHQKSVSIVEIDADGACRIETVPLEPRRDVRRIEGRLADLLAAAPGDEARDDFVFVVLTDTEALLNPLARLREHYPRCVELNRAAFLGVASSASERERDLRRRSDADLFAAFVHEVTGEPLSEAEADAFRDVVDARAREEREAES